MKLQSLTVRRCPPDRTGGCLKRGLPLLSLHGIDVQPLVSDPLSSTLVGLRTGADGVLLYSPGSGARGSRPIMVGHHYLPALAGASKAPQVWGPQLEDSVSTHLSTLNSTCYQGCCHQSPAQPVQRPNDLRSKQCCHGSYCRLPAILLCPYLPLSAKRPPGNAGNSAYWKRWRSLWRWPWWPP